MPTVLSTKKLSASQKQLLLNSGLGLVEYDAIHIKLLPFSGEISQQKNLIFTSKNAVYAFFKQYRAETISATNIFCVGEKTKDLLEKKGVTVVENSLDASSLGETIVTKYSDRAFLYFCGSKRRDELPEKLKKHKIEFEEVEVYTSSLNLTEFGRTFDGIFIYSPSGIESFCAKNDPGNSILFCIGSTTASEAKKYSDNVITATKPTIENLIVQAVKFFGTTAAKNISEKKQQ